LSINSPLVALYLGMVLVAKLETYKFPSSLKNKSSGPFRIILFGDTNSLIKFPFSASNFKIL